jgi:hypothetical protein
MHNEIIERLSTLNAVQDRDVIVGKSSTASSGTPTRTWSDYEQLYINDLYADLNNLLARTMQTKANIDKILSHLRQWGSQPMYVRHDGTNTTLMMPEDFPALIAQRQMDCLESKKLMEVISSMLTNILNVTNMIPLVANPTNSFMTFLEQTAQEVTEIFDMQADIMSLARDNIKKAIAFAKDFEKFNFFMVD